MDFFQVDSVARDNRNGADRGDDKIAGRFSSGTVIYALLIPTVCYFISAYSGLLFWRQSTHLLSNFTGGKMELWVPNDTFSYHSNKP